MNDIAQSGIDPDHDLNEAVFVALGSNDKGDWPSCVALLEAALARFRPEGLDVIQRSSWWSSLAWPEPSDPPFINGVVRVVTALNPSDTMAALGRIEDLFGRRRQQRNGPRTLDLDLIAYGRIAGDLDGLILPHPRAADRRFVMGPLAQIAPDWRHPVADATATHLLNAATIGSDASPLR